MDEHLRRIKDKMHVRYLGKGIQNELIQLLSNAIKQKILASARAAKYFSIILDCTPDAGHVEQMTMIIWFVDRPTSETENETESVCIKEHFLGFVSLMETTGAGVTETILHQLEEMSLPIENLRGQGYDNGSNMKGKENGVQQIILDINPRAFFIPCSAHLLNVVVSDAAKCCLEATAFFDLVQRVYVYSSASTRRWEVLTHHVSNLTVKPLSETRWESRIDALKPLRYQLGDIYDALLEIYDDTTLTGSSGNMSQVDAKDLAKAISSFKFLVSLVVWYDILFEINMISRQLQAKEFDISDAINQLGEIKKFLVGHRIDTDFEKTLVDAGELAEELDVLALFEPDTICIREKRKQFTYEADDKPIYNPKEKFKVNFYFAVIDTTVYLVEERLTLMQQISSVFGFLYDDYSLQNTRPKQIMEHCLNLEQALQHGESKDIDAFDLCNELQAITRRVQKTASPQDVLNFLWKNKLTDSVSNTVTALRILLTLPVSVASGERSFSKLKLIKTYMRTSVLQQRLVGLSTLSIEHDIACSIDLEELVSKFAKLKAWKNKF
ncbi:zinc finger MYM-type protein 1-like [Chelonia mydas]|uniref:zinc finger MYM-type protein 1-like n=1 Tax=Chelonia mydas TaxID=8469 RepID=UPI001CA878F6|nr:zinc finger MYM-type protein 1-like [Chelonia mydas]